MGEVAKWALLAAGIVLLIGMILVLPFTGFLDTTKLATGIADFVGIMQPYLISARGLLNNFFTPFGRVVINGLLLYLLAKWVVKLGVKLVAWVYHFIFK